ncbi:secretion/conjugation apparatus DotM-related subunit [Serratia sp. IR-2025]
MQNQPQRKGGGDDGLMIIGALLIMITVMWFGFRDYVIYGVCRLLYWIYGVLPDAITPGNAAERRDMLLSAARYNHQVSLWDFISVMNDTASVLFPLFILIIGLFVWVISRNPYYRLTRKLTIRNLPWVMVKNYPGIAHILARFGHLDQLLLNEDPEEARSAQSPVEFAQEHNLIDTAKRRLRKKAAHKVFLSQVNLAPEGAALSLAPWEKALAASFVHLRFMGDRPTAKSILDDLNRSCLRTKDGFPDYSLAAGFWTVASQCEAFREFAKGRRSSRSLLNALFDDDLQLPSANFRWLKGVDRTLWYALSSAGRGKFFIEGGGVIAWSQCESYRLTLDEEKAAKFPPTVRAAVLGLELDLLHYRHIDRRDPAIPVAHWQEDVIPPFAFESDAEAEDEPATPPAAPHDTPNNSLRLTDDEPTPAKPQPATRPDHLEL